jgi:RecA-family ATPase
LTDLLELLKYIPPSSLDYQEWVNVGMALKHEGYSVEVWDNWSQADNRWKKGDCQKKWKTFNESTSKIVTGGTIYEMAMQYGYKPREIRTFDWDDEIEYDGDPERVVKDAAWLDTNVIEMPKEATIEDFRIYLQTLFKPDDYVGYCIDAMFDETKQKWKPASRGVYDRKAKELLEAIKKHPNDIGAIIGDYNPSAGAWIRFNPIDGKGVNNTNVVDYRYALVESDSVEPEKQKALMEELKLPIALMIHSGGKSVHAIVKIFAVTEQDYREKVDYLYAICEKNGLKIDQNNKNASRLSRLPGVVRGDNKQFIIAQDIGCKTFDEWKEYIEGTIDTLPEIVSFADLKELPPLAPELIEGVLRKGHKMLIAGPSKAGKSFLLIELALSIASGSEWLEHKCNKGRVLYINLEVDGASFYRRVADTAKAMDIKVPDGLDIWNLRGENTFIEKLTPILLRRAKDKGYDAIIFDPLYKINKADENSASEMGEFFNYLDHVCKRLNVSVICCHHHSKGGQAQKSSIDRASGSGVFARDPDALMDMIRIDPRDVGKSLEKGETAWRISSTLREFESPEDIDVIFSHPIHRITEELKDAEPMYGAGSSTNSARGNYEKTNKSRQRLTRLLEFIENWDEIDDSTVHHPNPTIAEAVEYFKSDRGFSKSNIKKWAINYPDELIIDKGMLFLGQNENEK